MKLDTQGIERTLSQFDAQRIPDDHPAVPQLSELFGDHTFFVDQAGLHIVEPTAPADSGKETGKVVRLARWSDANRTSLYPHAPEPTDIVVELDSAA
jgi:hypothetical protein